MVKVKAFAERPVEQVEKQPEHKLLSVIDPVFMNGTQEDIAAAILSRGMPANLVGEVPEPEWIECPLTGELIALSDVDGLIDCFERLKAQSDAIYAVLILIRRTLADKAEGHAKTRRLRGRRRAVKIEMPGSSWSQGLLKEAFNSYPAFRDGIAETAS